MRLYELIMRALDNVHTTKQEEEELEKFSDRNFYRSYDNLNDFIILSVNDYGKMIDRMKSSGSYITDVLNEEVYEQYEKNSKHDQ